MKTDLARLPSARILERLIQSPDLVERVQRLPPEDFSALIRRVGVEDAGELIALGTTEQLTRAFDEDLFTAEGAGERERFDGGRGQEAVVREEGEQRRRRLHGGDGTRAVDAGGQSRTR